MRVVEANVLKQRRKTKRCSILRSIVEVEDLLNCKLPEKDCYKFISNGGFSSISFIMYIADRAKINKLYASTLRVGKREARYLDVLKREGKLKNAHFVIGSIMAEDKRNKKYGYYEDFVKVCKANNWKYVIQNNHSKILLFDCGKRKFVIETSSNLNENPRIEQFSFEEDKELFYFYKEWFKDLFKKE